MRKTYWVTYGSRWGGPKVHKNWCQFAEGMTRGSHGFWCDEVTIDTAIETLSKALKKSPSEIEIVNCQQCKGRSK